MCSCRLSYERRCDISFIDIIFCHEWSSKRGTKYDIVTIKLILPSLKWDNLFITYLCFHLEQNSDHIFKLLILWVYFESSDSGHESGDFNLLFTKIKVYIFCFHRKEFRIDFNRCYWVNKLFQKAVWNYPLLLWQHPICKLYHTYHAIKPADMYNAPINSS